MMSVAVTNWSGARHRGIADERELWIVGREFERPPYFHAARGRYPPGPCLARVHRRPHYPQE